MRLMQHMLPQLLTDVAPVAPPVEVPEGAVLAKAFDPVSLIAGAVTAGANAVGMVSSSRAQQVWAREQTLQADIAAQSAAQQREDLLKILKYVIPAGLLALTIYLLLR